MMEWNVHIVTGGDNILEKNSYNTAIKEELNMQVNILKVNQRLINSS
jgi:hypothetical protein